MPVCGDALFIPSGPQGNHLFIVLNDPQPLPGYGAADHCVMVNLSSIEADIPYDATCVLQPGQHPFIVRPSYVYYRGTRIERANHIRNCIQTGIFTRRPPPFAPDLVAVIKHGLNASPKVARAFKGLPI